MTRRSRTIALTLAVLAAAPASLALARQGGRDAGGVLVAGSCGKGATSKLAVKPDSGRLEVEFEVDQNRSGVPWNVVITHERRLAVQGRRVTRAPSGSFSVELRVADLAGADQVIARATSRTGLTCRATATLPAGAGRAEG